MALHGQMRPDSERLVGAESIREYSPHTRREAERLSMPLEDGCRARLAETVRNPVPGDIVVFGVRRSPAYFPERAARDRPAESLADQLSPQAMSDHRDVAGDGVPDQGAFRLYPRQRIVDAHRPAQQAQAGVSARAWRGRFAAVDGDQTPGNPAGIEECGKIAWTFRFRVAKNGNRFHR